MKDVYWDPREEIIRLDSMIKDNHGHWYPVFLERDVNTGKWVLGIEGTPGHWYMDNLRGYAYDEISLDWGQKWTALGFQGILLEAEEKLRIKPAR